MEVAVRKALPYLPAVLWAALILYIGGRSNVPTVDTTLPLDKAAHFVMYGILGALTTWGWVKAHPETQTVTSVLWVMALAMALGMVDEVQQRNVPGRSAEVKDWLADAAGVAVASALVLRYAKRGAANAV